MEPSAEDCAGVMLEAIPAAMRVIRQHLRAHRLAGLSVPQLRVLGFLDRCGPATLSAVAEHVGTTRPTMSRMIQALVERQLVRRQGGSLDRRTVCLEIAAKGRRILEIARRATVAQLAQQIGSLRAEEVGRLRQAMSLLLRMVATENRPGRPPEKVFKQC